MEVSDKKGSSLNYSTDKKKTISLFFEYELFKFKKDQVMPKLIQIRPHAKKQLRERQIPEDLIKETLLCPGQVIDSYSGRKIAQDIIEHKKERFLVRIIYEETGKELRVITVYLTTKIEKYWR